MPETTLRRDILQYVAQEQQAGGAGVPAGTIQAHVDRPRPTVNRALAALVETGELERLGAGRAVRYRVAQAQRQTPAETHEVQRASRPSPPWSADAHQLMASLSAPMGTRKPVTYQRYFVDEYEPNVSSLLPKALAEQLLKRGQSRDQQPAGTYARKVLEQLLIDLSWFSSRLEGNRKSQLDTRELFERGRSNGDDRDATMLLNHKEAIEFMVDAVPVEGMTTPVVRNLQSLLMRDLLPDPADLGAIRSKIVHIQGSVYLPNQVPKYLEEMLGQIIAKATLVHNPIEAAFFLWVNLAYLQPFVDGNKRTSRLSANIPLMLTNCAPLAFLDVEQHDYALAMLGVYERLDVSVAVELFEWTYRRSIDKYQVIVESMSQPDPLRARYREQLGEAVRRIVFHGATLLETVESFGIHDSEIEGFAEMVDLELRHLEAYNCARYRLPMGSTQEWIGKGRPR